MKKLVQRNDGLYADLDAIFTQALSDKIFPGAAVGISYGYGKQQKSIIKTYGYLYYDEKSLPTSADTFFDLASLTKPLATTLAVLSLIHDKKLSLETYLSAIFCENIAADKKGINIRHLLNHCSGLPAHRDYFRIIVDFSTQERPARVLEKILAEPVLAKPGEKEIYSDIGFILLGFIVEKISNLSLPDFVRQKIFKPLHLDEYLYFSPELKHKKGIVVAPTEFCQWRQRLMAGEVSDENDWAMGGAAGHAGLFGNIKGVLKMAVHLLDQWQGREDPSSYNTDELRYFLRRQNMVAGSTWALGFDTPSAINSSAGSISPGSAGHLGFTGTSFWLDPQMDLAMVLLTNRVHPRRDNEKIKKFRPLFHNTVIDFFRNMEK